MKVLCIQNGGLGNDVSQDDLMPLVSSCGDVEGIVMIARKSYCFVCYKNVTGATEAYHRLNGFVLRENQGPAANIIIYLLYVEKAPGNVMPSQERPPGLHIIEDFISEDLEEALVELIHKACLSDAAEKGVMKHRQVKHYGYEFKYGINDVDVSDPLPEGIPKLCHSFLEEALSRGIVSHFPDQLTVNVYKPGQGIPPHVDTPEAFEDGIMSLSLGSQVVMDFRHPDGRHLCVLLPPRSLLVMTGESRYTWSHGITPRKSDIIANPAGDSLTLQHRTTRTSFTFRKVVMDRESRRKEGDISTKVLPKTNEEAVALERDHVHQVYEDIAEHFSGTRYKPWPRVVDFLMEQPPLSLLVDVGCGNGKCLGVGHDFFEIGSDFSKNLASICHSRGFETCVADITCLPFCSNSMDVVLCIAVIHHLATKARRHQALSEIMRILRRGGRALIYAWAMEQNLEQKPSKYISVNRQKRRETGIDLNGEEQDVYCEEGLPDLSRVCVDDEHTDGRMHEKSRTGEVSDTNRIVDRERWRVRESLTECKNRPSKCDAQEYCTSTDAAKSGEEGEKLRAVFSVPIRRGSKETIQSVNGASSDLPDSRTGRHDRLSQYETNLEPCAAQSQSTDLIDSASSLSPEKRLHVHVNRTLFKEQDMLVPWQLKSKPSRDQSGEECRVFHRFYHVFRQGELEAMCKRVSECCVKKSYYDQGNWCVVLEKV